MSSSNFAMSLNMTLNFARNNSNLDKDEIDVILSARRTVIDYNRKYWSRKDRPDDWDITIGSKDSAEITDLVYILFKDEISILPTNRKEFLFQIPILPTECRMMNSVSEVCPISW